MDWQPWTRPPADDSGDRPETAPDALARLLAGNRRFSADAAGCACPDPLARVAPVRQTPYGVVLGCSDARVPLEILFDAGPNQLFVVRVAGNVLGEECLGSIEYALHTFRESVRLLVVLGHTGCGAVAAAVETYLSPKHHAGIAFSRSLRAVVNHILVAVRSAALSLEQVYGADVVEDPHFRDALAELTVPLNAAMAAYQLRQDLRPAAGGGPDVVYGVFDLVTSRVFGPPEFGTGALTPALTSPAELVELGLQLARSPAVARHLHLLSGPFSEDAGAP